MFLRNIVFVAAVPSHIKKLLWNDVRMYKEQETLVQINSGQPFKKFEVTGQGENLTSQDFDLAQRST